MINIEDESGRKARSLFEKIRTALADNPDERYVIGTIDFDNFNYINDLFGFECGDEVLNATRNQFNSVLQNGEFCVNVHGDYFIFFLKGNSEKHILRQIKSMCDFKNTFKNILPELYNLHLSGGVIHVDRKASLPSLLDKANFARKKAKEQQCTTVLFYTEEMGKEVEWRKIITMTIEEALQDGEFEMYLQPKINMQNDSIVGAEALARWNSKKFGLIFPDRFIHILEQNGYIRRLDFLMLESACQFVNRLKESGLPDFPISVNFSKIHIHTPEFVKNIQETVDKYGVRHELIELELTETMFSGDFNRMIEVAATFKKMGFKVSLDDFGSAYSSLNYLKELPVDIIKIDKGFLDESKDTVKGQIIIAKMVELIKSLRLVSVMEGVETEEQADFLRALGCDLAQGYFYAKPMPSDQFFRLVKENSWKSKKDEIQKKKFSFEDRISRQLDAVDDKMDKVDALKRILAAEFVENDILRATERKYKLAIKQNNEVVFEWDFFNDRIDFSDNLSLLLGKKPIRENISSSKELRTHVHADDLATFEDWINRTYKKVGCTKTEFRLDVGKNDFVWLKIRATTVVENGVPAKAVGMISDINQQRNELNSLIERAKLDPLTKLLNKEEFRDKVVDLIQSGSCALGGFIIVDIDDFKGVNDNLGHQFGDMVIRDTAERIRNYFQPNALIGRLGGDEIAIFTYGDEDEDGVEKTAKGLIDTLRTIYFGASKKYNVSVSAGVCMYPNQADTFDELYRLSDIALYESKARGKDCATVFYEELSDCNIRDARTPVEWTERFLSTYFNGDFIYNVFEMLYETNDHETTLQHILEAIGKKYSVDRVYIFEDSLDGKTISNTFEWCAEGIKSEIKTLQNLPLDDFQSFFDKYSKEGIFACSDISTLDGVAFETLTRQGVKSILHCAISDGSARGGFIGFDVCKRNREWRGEELAILGYISRILSVYLWRNHALSAMQATGARLESMLDNLNGYVYLIDKNFDIRYINGAMRAEGIKVGEKCYKEAFGMNQPCKNCPVQQLTDGKRLASEEIYSQKLDCWVLSAASQIQWTNEETMSLVCCSDISKYRKTHPGDES